MDMTTTRRIEYLPRSRRRLLVAVGLASYPLAVVALAVLKHTSLDRWLILALFLVFLLPAVAAVLAGYRYARGRIDGRGLRLDERDIQLRQQAYAASHRVLAAALIAATAGTEVYLTSVGTMRFDPGTFLPAMMWVVVFIPALPSLMLAWIEADQPADA
jgi:hypothetical protein